MSTPVTSPRSNRRAGLVGGIFCLSLLGMGACMASLGEDDAQSAPAVTVTTTAPAPTKTVEVPGPAKTVTAPAAAPTVCAEAIEAANEVIGTQGEALTIAGEALQGDFSSDSELEALLEAHDGQVDAYIAARAACLAMSGEAA